MTIKIFLKHTQHLFFSITKSVRRIIQEKNRFIFQLALVNYYLSYPSIYVNYFADVFHFEALTFIIIFSFALLSFCFPFFCQQLTYFFLMVNKYSLNYSPKYTSTNSFLFICENEEMELLVIEN